MDEIEYLEGTGNGRGNRDFTRPYSPGYGPEDRLTGDKKGDRKMVIPISEGFIEVTPGNINVVVRTAELPEEIDVERARRAKERAEKRLNGLNGEEVGLDYIDYVRARAALERALARFFKGC